MFDYFVCALLSFCVRKFDAKLETQEPMKIIVEWTSYDQLLETTRKKSQGHCNKSPYFVGIWFTSF